MTFGPLEFSVYLRRRELRPRESATVRAAREMSGAPLSEENILRVISGPSELTPMWERPEVSLQLRAQQQRQALVHPPAECAIAPTLEHHAARMPDVLVDERDLLAGQRLAEHVEVGFVVEPE